MRLMIGSAACGPLRSRNLIGTERQLLAILLNPPATTSGMRSLNAVARAASALSFDRVEVANLCATPTATVVHLNALGHEAWGSARGDLRASLVGADAVLAGWGVGGLSGDPRRWMEAQVDWLSERAQEVGIETFWTIGGEPRHPSRWHQYVSDRHARTMGGTFEERIGQVLVEVPARNFRARSHDSRLIDAAT